MTTRILLCLFSALLGVVYLFGSLRPAQAQIPRTFSYQGIIHAGGGQPIPNDDHAITISLYDIAEGGTALYSETHNTRTINGIFNIIIGTVMPMPSSLAFDKTYYLGVRVDGSNELTPRTALASVPYAIRASFADVASRLAGDVKGVVTSVNELAGSLRIEGDSTMTVTQSGQTIRLSAKQNSNVVYKGIDSITSPQKTLSIINPTGNVTRVDVADSAISTLKLARGSVTSEKLNAMGATNGQVLKWNGTAWIPAADAGGVVVVTPRLIGNGTVGTPLDIAQQGATNGQVLSWNGTTWAPATVGGLNTVTATAPLTGNGTAISPLVIAAATNATNGYLTSADWTTFNNKLSAVTVTPRLAGNGTVGNPLELAQQGATNGQVLSWNGATWAPASIGGLNTVAVTAPITGNGTVGNPLTIAPANGTTNGYLTSTDWTTFNNKLSSVSVTARLSGNGTVGNPLDIAQQGATPGQMLKWNGATWLPADDIGITSVTALAPITGTGTSSSPLTMAAANGTTNGYLTSTDWTTFNNKLSSVSVTARLTGNGTVGSPLDIAQQGATNGQALAWNGTTWVPTTIGGLTTVAVTAPITGNGTVGNPLAMAAANGTTNGYLTSTDWTTFNNKLTSVAVTARLTGNGTVGSPLDIAQQGATNGQVLSWNGTTWIPANGGLSSITTDATLGGNGTVGTPLKIAQQGATSGQTLKWNGTTWLPADDNGLTSVSVTPRLTGNGTTGNPLDIAQQGATSGQVLSWNGTMWTPANGGLSSVTTDATLTGNGTVATPLRIAQQGATTGQALKWNGTTWLPGDDNGLTSVSVTARLIGSGTVGSPLDIAQQGATNGQVLAWNGTTWVPANGGLSSVSVTAPITGNGTSGNPLAMAAANGTTNGYLTSTDWTTFNNKLSTVSVTPRLTGNGTVGSPLDIAQQGATNGQALAWNGTTWVPTTIGGLTTVAVTAPITGNGTAGNPLVMAAANGTTNGYLTSTDWTTFNNKLSTVSVTARLTGNGTVGSPLDIAQQGATNGQALTWNGTTWVPTTIGGLTTVAVTAPITGNGTVGNPLAMAAANGTTNGYLTSTDWTTFNNKLSSVAVTARLTGNGTVGSPLDIAQQGATNGQVLSWNGTTWVPANGGLSAVTTDATLGGNGTATTPLTIAQQGATSGQTLKWNGTTWLPADDNGLTSVSVTARLTGNGTVGSPLDIAQQGATNGQALTWNGTTWVPTTIGGLTTVAVTAPITGNGTVGNPLAMAAANGTTNGYLTSTDWTTFNNKLSTVSVTARLTGNGTVGSPLDIAQQGAINGQVLAWNGTIWAPANDNGGTVNVTARLSGNGTAGNPLDIDQQGAANGQVLTWNGTTWVPANGGLSSVSVTAPITGNGTAGNPLVMAAANGTTNGYLTSTDWTTFNNKLSTVSVTARLTGNGTVGSPLDIAQQGATTGQVLRWSGTTWLPGTDNGLTTVSVNAPITGNGTSGSPISLAQATSSVTGYLTSTDWNTFNNKLSSVSVTARLTGNGTTGNPLDLAQQGATTGQVLTWNGSTWSPATSGGLTTVSVTARLTGNGTVGNPLDIAQQGATNGQVLKWNGSTWSPGADNANVSVTARLTGDGSAGNPLDIAQQGATNGQVLTWNGATWLPAAGGLSSVSVTARLTGNGTVGSPLDIAQQGATNGQVLSWNGTTWLPANGGLSSVSVTAPITGNGTSGNPLAMAAANGTTNGYLTSTDWTTFNNKLSTVSVTARLTGNGTVGSPLDIAQQGATNGQVLSWNGTSWVPAADNGLVVVTTDLTLTGSGTLASPLGLASQSASNGQVLKWNGSIWAPAADNSIANGTANDNTLRWSGTAWEETSLVKSSTSGMLSISGNSGGSGGVNLSGTTTPLLLNSNSGTSGFVLASQGVGATPSWVDPATFATPGWSLSGNTLTGASSSSPTQFFGSNNSYDLLFKTNALERMRISAGGTVAIGTSTTNLAQFTVNSTLPGNATQRHGAYIYATLNSDPGVYSNGMEVQYNVANTGALGAGSQVDGSVVAITSLQGAGTNAARGAIGLVALGSSTPNATHSALDGLTGRIYIQSAGANTTITNAVAVRADLYMLTSGATITNGYGFRVDNPFDASHFTAGTISNFTGVYVQDITTGAGTRNAIFYDAAGSSSAFVVTALGRTGIGNATPTEKLEVRNGNILLSNNNTTAGQLQFMNPAASFVSTFAAGAQTATYNYTLPISLPTTNQVLTATSITGTGPYAVTLGWTTPAGGSSWGILGNGGTVAGTNFIGTTDNVALHLYANSGTSNSFILNTNGSIQRLGGNARGTNSVDFQISRAAVTQVAGATGSVISGGENNEIGTSANYSTIGGGIGNTISATHSSIVGGNGNTASGSYNTVLGGRGLTLSGNYSVGYNAGATAMSVSDGNTAILGNTNLWLANNNNTASDLRFYEANNGGAGAFPPAGINFSAIRAGIQGTDIVYVLPNDTPSSAGSMMQVVSKTGTNPQTVQLGWTSGGGQGWLLMGNNLVLADTSTSFLGTTSNVFVEVQANSSASSGGNGRMFRFEPNGTSPNLIGGHRLNVVSGGFNTANRVYGASILGGGDDSNPNRVSDNYGIVLGGSGNRAGDNDNTYGDKEYAVVAGGINNKAEGQYSFIAGGGNLTLGDNSFAFNGRQTGGAPFTADLSAQTGIAYFGDVNLWIGNVNNSARQLRFYEPNSSSTYSGANYTSFQAATQSADITYTLPISAPSSSHRLMMGSSTGQLSWSPTIAFDSTNARLGVNLNSTPNTTVDVNGDVAMRRSNVAVANGNNHNLSIGNFSFIKLTGTNNFTITGIAGGVDGKMIIIYNATGQIMTLSNNDAGSNAGNRLRSKTGNNYVTANAGERDVVTLIYDSASSEWIVVSTN